MCTVVNEESIPDSRGVLGDIPVVLLMKKTGRKDNPLGPLPYQRQMIQNVCLYEKLTQCFLDAGCRSFYVLLPNDYRKLDCPSPILSLERHASTIFQEMNADDTEVDYLAGMTDRLRSTLFLAQGNVFVDKSYEEILRYHKKSGNLVTVVCAVKNIEIPYRTVELDGNSNIRALHDNPRFTFLVQTGFYVLEPKVFDVIAMLSNHPIALQDLLRQCMCRNMKAGAYLVREDCFCEIGRE